MNIDFLKQNIDFTNVKPDVSVKEINKFCKQALFHKVKTIYVPPVFVVQAVSQVGKNGIDVGTIAGFPYGNIPIELKKGGIAWAARHKARWVDVCLNISSVKSNNYSDVEKEIKQLTAEAYKHKIGLKIIVESPYLTKNELIRVTELIDYYHVDYIKTASGVGNQITEKDVKIIKPILKYSKLKAAGGISRLDQAIIFFNLGADKIGSSKGFEILGE